MSNVNASTCQCEKTIGEAGAAKSLDVDFLDDGNDDNISVVFVVACDLFLCFYVVVVVFCCRGDLPLP